jgi:D-cysteine desulfhydrase
MRLDELSRFTLGVWPTPLRAAPRLSDAIGVPVFIKRDDLSGLGLGGNKVRKLEYLIGDALDQGADVVVTGGGAQSNHAALTALAAARAGMSAHLVFYGNRREGAPEGNGVLNALVGVETTYTGVDDRSSVDSAMSDVAAKLKAAGRRPYVIPRGGATSRGCAGYVAASREMAGQLADLGISPDRLFVATGSCGTQAGLVLGARWLGARYRVVGVTVSRPREECLERVHRLVAQCAKLLGLDGEEDEEVTVIDGYMGPGYGKPSDEGRAAMELVAQTEGLVLDPVFTAKAMAALLDNVKDRIGGAVVFLHTGGAPATFASSLQV